MKKLSYLLTLLLLVTLMTGCKAFHTLMDSKLKTAQGAPYELIVVCNQQLWESELGDTLRSVLLAPIPYLNEREPLFNVMQFPESGFKGTVVDYRNILKVLVDPSLAAASAGVQYDVTASPQVVVTLQGPTREALTQYVAEHRAELVQTFEGAERDRSIAFANKFNQTESGKLCAEVAAAAKECSVPVLLLSGALKGDLSRFHQIFDCAFSTSSGAHASIAEAVRAGRSDLYFTALNIAKLINSGICKK